jgi:hypothetical protein
MIMKQPVTKFKDGIDSICLGEGFFDTLTLTKERTLSTYTWPLPSPFFWYKIVINVLPSVGAVVE